MFAQQGLEVPRGDRQGAERGQRRHRRASRLVVDERDLAEVVAAAQRSQLPSFPSHLCLATQDQVKADTSAALAHHLPARGVLDLVRGAGHGAKLTLVEPLEEGDLLEYAGELP